MRGGVLIRDQLFFEQHSLAPDLAQQAAAAFESQEEHSFLENGQLAQLERERTAATARREKMVFMMVWFVSYWNAGWARSPHHPISVHESLSYSNVFHSADHFCLAFRVGQEEVREEIHSGKESASMRNLRSWWKRLGKRLVARVNVEIPRELNGTKIVVPVIEGRKTGVSGERWMSGLLKRLLDAEKGTFYDVGVNLGQTLAKVKTLESDRVYVGFEPSPFCQYYLSRLTECNAWSSVTICPCALFDRDMLLPMNGAAEGAAAATLIAELRPESKGATTLVPAFQYDAVAEALPHGKVGIIKIDVEGAEVEVIRSLSGLIARDLPVITLEVLPLKGADTRFRESRNAELKTLLEGLGYVLHVVQKSDDDHFAGIKADPDFAEHSDARFKDYVAIPAAKVARLTAALGV